MNENKNEIILDSFKKKFSPPKNNHVKNILKLPDSEIYYEIIGEGSPLIFAHGLGGNHLSWWQQIPYFSEQFKCITFSHRGFSISKNYSNKVGASVFADDLESLINYLALEEVNIVAQSMGGWTALNYALRNNSKVRSLVMASSTGELNFSDISHIAISRLQEWKEKSDQMKTELEICGGIASTGLRMAVEKSSMNFLYKQIYDLTPNSYKNAVREKIRGERILPSDVLKKLEIPTLFITGDEDIIFPPVAAEAAASLIKNSSFKRVEKAGHSVYFEKPEIFNKLIYDFLYTI